MSIVIKKRLSLDFLGEEYKDSYIDFRSMPLPDYEASIPISAKAVEDKKALAFILEQVKKYFLAGECIDENGKLNDVTIDDLDSLDVDVVERCFTVLSGLTETAEGVSIPEDLKDESMIQSTTEVPNPLS